ncbi:MAG TPA: peptide-methionine (S)-S-oxide reductase MsrA [Candidatus Saccharimonadales bacterium]|jgi:peptide-methionine (S)-S-oxide reductase|nr:peptide-methionine (S)-S-oxide reductase MsrA [Candidatus Saccharimonadales bacterium]
MKTIYLAGGCFWGMEQLFRSQDGVIGTEVGYTGGTNNNPNYHDHPGHAEAIEITYDENKTSYKDLLDFFFRIHDPTTLNRQGNDEGSSYRSAIFYQTDNELKIAKDVIKKIDALGFYKNPIITSLEKFNKFYVAEDYHQDYLQNNPNGYTCHFIRTDQHLIK